MVIENLHIKLLRKLKLLGHFKLSGKATLHGKTFRIPLEHGKGLANLYIQENWLGKMIRALDLKSGETFVDVGVNLGQTLLQLRSVNEQVRYAGFEPNGACCSYVEKLIAVNGLKACTLHEVALSDKEALVDFEFDSDTDPRASINTQQRPGYFSRRIKVEALPFDTAYDAYSTSLVKIDVEGAELAVLKGMKKQLQEKRPLIVCEVLDSHGEARLQFTQLQADELADYLQALDYRIIQLVQDETHSRVLSYEEKDHFEIKNWTPQSMQTNDYLFFPAEKWPLVRDVLQKISKKNA